MGLNAWLGLFLVGSVTVACGAGDDEADEDDYQYDKADVAAAMFGTWQGTWQPTDGSEPSAFELQVRLPDEPPLESRCGNRTLGNAGLAPQCASMSSMAVSGTANLAGSEPVELDGGLTIPSLILSEVWLSLAGEGAPFSLVAQWDDTNGWNLCRAEDGAGAVIASCTLTERAP